jgi:P27 family predicted phage terminase small subunit
MPRGPKPEPAAVRDQKEPVRSVHQPRLPSPEASFASNGAVEPPKWLRKEGRRIWDRLSPPLQAAKLLTQADAETFARYCRNFARWIDAEKAIDKEGATYESESQWGKLKRVNPVFLIADRLERQLLAIEDRFGLNPAERQRIFAARAQTGAPGDLFSQQARPSDRRERDPATQPTQPAEPIEAPEGFLN